MTYTTHASVQENDLLIVNEPQGPEMTGSEQRTRQHRHRLDPQGKLPGISSMTDGSLDLTACCLMFQNTSITDYDLRDLSRNNFIKR